LQLGALNSLFAVRLLPIFHRQLLARATFAVDLCRYNCHAEKNSLFRQTISLEVKKPVKKSALALLLAVALAPAAAIAQVGVVVRVGPPAPIVEHYGPPPHPGYVWISGYHRWDGNRYVWTHGHWDRPPRPGAVWVPHRWEHRHGGYVLVQGHWR
jgi:hypothetical protein